MRKPCSSLVKSLTIQASPTNGLIEASHLSSHLSLHLRICADKKSLVDGMLAHDETIRADQEKNVYLGSLIVDLYGKCGALYDMHTWFDRMQDRSVFSWNCLINAYVRHTRNCEAMQSFEQMQQECMIPNGATFGGAVAACASKGALIQGMWLHARTEHSHLESYVIVQTALVSMYNKCGKFRYAQMVFEVMVERDTVSWNAMLAAFVVQQDGKIAIQFFAQMQMECIIQDKFTYATMFTACSNKETLKTGNQIHACALRNGFEMNHVMELALVNMYSKCGSVCHAKAVFDASSKQDMALWNAVIAACTNSANDGQEVVYLFDRLLEEALLPNNFTFLSVLAECANEAAPWQGRQLHVRLGVMPLKLGIEVKTALVHMYGKLGMTTDAGIMFERMPDHDAVSWNVMISILIQNSFMSAAFQHYGQMQQEGLLPTNITITIVLSGCTDSASLMLGKHVHALVVSSGLTRDVSIGNALINMYCKCGLLEDAHRQFDATVSRDTITWNSLIAGYAQNGDHHMALYVFNQMCVQDMIPDQASYVSMLSAIANEVTLIVSYKGESSSTRTKSESTPHTFDTNNEVKIAESFNPSDNEEQMHAHKVASSVSSILGFPHHGSLHKDDEHHAQSGLAVNAPGKNASQLGWLAEGMVLHSHIMLNGLDSDIFVEKALLKFYARCGSLRDSEIMFTKFSKHDVISWNIMTAAYILQGHDKEAIQMFDLMQKEKIVLDNVAFLSVIDACANMASLWHGRQMHTKVVYHGFHHDPMVATALVTLYAKCDSLAEARWTFDHLSKRDVVAWTSIITAYVQLGNSEEALELFEQMQREGVTADVVAFTSALNACESRSSLLEGKMIHTCITHYRMESDADVLIALVYMYGKGGSLFDAMSIFNRVLKPNLSLWNAFIASYAQHGDGQEVFRLLHSMLQQGMTPNTITFVSILCACSRAGLVDEAYGCLKRAFKMGFAPVVELYDCMVDLLGRVGQLDEAEDLLNMMPFIPTVVSWASFLATCHNQIDTKRAEAATIHLIEMDHADPVTYVTLSNIYAVAEGLDERVCL